MFGRAEHEAKAGPYAAKEVQQTIGYGRGWCRSMRASGWSLCWSHGARTRSMGACFNPFTHDHKHTHTRCPPAPTAAATSIPGRPGRSWPKTSRRHPPNAAATTTTNTTYTQNPLSCCRSYVYSRAAGKELAKDIKTLGVGWAWEALRSTGHGIKTQVGG